MDVETDPRTEFDQQNGIRRLEITNGLSHWMAIAEIPKESGQITVINRHIKEEDVFKESSDSSDKSPGIWVPQQNILELLTYPQVEAQMKKIQQLNGAYQIIPVAIDNNLVAITEANGLYIPGYTWTHEKSKARYFMISKDKSPGVRGYMLEGKEETSNHWHLKRSEIVHLVWGKAEIDMDGISRELHKSVEIPVGVKHRIRAKDNGAVLVVITRGPGDCLSMDDHNYHSQASVTP